MSTPDQNHGHGHGMPALAPPQPTFQPDPQYSIPALGQQIADLRVQRDHFEDQRYYWHTVATQLDSQYGAEIARLTGELAATTAKLAHARKILSENKLIEQLEPVETGTEEQVAEEAEQLANAVAGRSNGHPLGIPDSHTPQG